MPASSEQSLNGKLFVEFVALIYLSYIKKQMHEHDLFENIFLPNHSINMKSSADQKKFIDELRCRNGNLTIFLTLKEYETGTALA